MTKYVVPRPRKRARAKNRTGRTRRENVHVFFTPEEKNALEDVCIDRNLSVSDLVRTLVRVAAEELYAVERKKIIRGAFIEGAVAPTARKEEK